MSQRSLRSQKKLSQINCTNSDETEISFINSSQNNGLPPAIRIVRFILTRDNNLPIKRSNLINLCNDIKITKDMKTQIINDVQRDLTNIFGLSLDVLQSDENFYIINNILPNVDLINKSTEVSFQTNITLLILSFVYICKDSALEEKLWQFLEEFSITQDTLIMENENMENFITKYLVKTQILQINEVIVMDSSKKYFSWGVKAKQLYSIETILQFIHKISDLNNGNEESNQEEEMEDVETSVVLSN